MQKIISIITARGGSKGLPNKNIIDLYGNPLIYWSIEFAKKSELISDCIVTTDSDQIAEISKSCGASVPFLREKSLATDTSTTPDVLLDVFKRCQLNDKDIFLLLEPTSPFRLHNDFNDLVAKYIKYNFKKMVSVQEAISSSHRFQFFQNENATLTHINGSSYPNNLRRQDVQSSFYPDGSFYLSTVAAFRNNPGFYEESTGSFVNNFFSSFEIDCLDDLKLMEAIFSHIGPPF